MCAVFIYTILPLEKCFCEVKRYEIDTVNRNKIIY